MPMTADSLSMDGLKISQYRQYVARSAAVLSSSPITSSPLGTEDKNQNTSEMTKESYTGHFQNNSPTSAVAMTLALPVTAQRYQCVKHTLRA